jgi:hypothetical protein
MEAALIRANKSLRQNGSALRSSEVCSPSGRPCSTGPGTRTPSWWSAITTANSATPAGRLKAVQRDLGGLLEVCLCETGLHLIGSLTDGWGDRELSQAALRAGVEAPPLLTYCVERTQRGGLMLGYAGSDGRQIRDAVRRLGAALREDR